MENEKIDWKGFVRERILQAIEERGKGGFATVRAVYYYLGSLNIIPMTKQGYKNLDRLVVKMRKNEEIPWGYFPVVRGTNGTSPRQYWKPDEYFNSYKQEFLKCDSNYNVPVWYNQRYLVEIWVEKKGLLPKIENYVSDLDIQVRALEGYPPWEFAYESIQDMQDYYLADRDDDAKIVILYLGDLDPSGIDIDRQVQEAFDHFDVPLIFRRIGLLPEQVHRYGLPPIPENDEVLAKIHRDSRYAKYLSEYGERFTELDAWEGINPQGMRNEVRAAVMEFFDQGIYEKSRQIKDENQKKIRELLDDAKKKLGE